MPHPTRLPDENMWPAESARLINSNVGVSECGQAGPTHVVDAHNAGVFPQEDLPGGIHKDAIIVAAEGGPARPGHVVDAHEALVVRYVDLSCKADEDAEWPGELTDPASIAAEGRPTRSSQVVDTHDTIIMLVRNEDLSGRVHRDVSRSSELVDPATISAKGGPSRPGHVVDAHEAVSALLRDKDLPGGRKRARLSVDRYQDDSCSNRQRDSNPAPHVDATPTHVPLSLPKRYAVMQSGSCRIDVGASYATTPTFLICQTR